MLKTKNYNMNKPELPDSVDISKLNENFDIIDEKVKEVETKADNIKVPVQSVNNKTGNIVLNSTDIKCTDGTTIEAKLGTKADTFNKSSSVTNPSSTDVATSYAVYSVFNSLTNLQNSKGQPGGLASLGTDGKIPNTQLPPIDVGAKMKSGVYKMPSSSSAVSIEVGFKPSICIVSIQDNTDFFALITPIGCIGRPLGAEGITVNYNRWKIVGTSIFINLDFSGQYTLNYIAIG